MTSSWTSDLSADLSLSLSYLILSHYNDITSFTGLAVEDVVSGGLVYERYMEQQQSQK